MFKPVAALSFNGWYILHLRAIEVLHGLYEKINGLYALSIQSFILSTQSSILR